MTENIEEGFMAFIADGQDGIGAVREVNNTSIVIYVENAGEFVIPRSAVQDVHSEKVILRPDRLDKRLLAAVGHIHDSEDPNLVGYRSAKAGALGIDVSASERKKAPEQSPEPSLIQRLLRDYQCASTASSSRATILVILMAGLTAGPAVSL